MNRLPMPCSSFQQCVSFITFDRQSSILLLSFAIRTVINVIIIIGCHPALYCFERPLPYRADTSGSGCQFAQFTGWSFADFIGLIRHDDFLAFSVLANSTPRSNGEPAISSTEMNTMNGFNARFQCHGTMWFYRCRHYPQ